MAVAHVSGALRFSNGELPCLLRNRLGAADFLGSPTFICSISGAGAQVTLTWTHDSASDDDARRMASHVLDNELLPLVLVHGIGLQTTLEQVVWDNGRAAKFIPDTAQSGPELVDVDGLSVRLGTNPQFRWALRDFNRGLLDREEAPFMFYRALESAVRAVTGVKRINSAAWSKFDFIIGTNKADIRPLKLFADDHRHGDRVEFSGDQRAEMAALTMRVLRLASTHVQPVVAEAGPELSADPS